MKRALVVVFGVWLLSACGTRMPAGSLPPAPQAFSREASASETLVAHPAGLGAILTTTGKGQIEGFALGPGDGKGLLSSTGHIETFDATDGTIANFFPASGPANTTYGMDGVFAGGVALVTRYVVPKGTIYATRYYDVVSPFNANVFTGKWTPPVFDVDVMQSAQDPVSTTSVLFAIELKNNDIPDLFVSDVGANTFGRVIHLDANLYSLGDGPNLATHTFEGKAVLATSPDAGAVGAPGAAPINALVDLSTGALTQFKGLNNGYYGSGYVNGMDVDPNTGVEVTTTELNAQVEFYNLKTRRAIAAAQLPCTTNTLQYNSAAGVGVDPVNKLILVADPYYACDGGKDGALVVYDESGKLVETIPHFTFFIAEPAPVVDPATRSGWVFGPHLYQLQQFFY